jgi:hypothetical protein
MAPANKSVRSGIQNAGIDPIILNSKEFVKRGLNEFSPNSKRRLNEDLYCTPQKNEIHTRKRDEKNSLTEV